MNEKVVKELLVLTSEIGNLMDEISFKLDKSEVKHIKPVEDGYVIEVLKDVETDLQKLFDKINAFSEKVLIYEELRRNGNLQLNKKDDEYFLEMLNLDFAKANLLMNNHSENGEPKHDKTVGDLQKANEAFKKEIEKIFDVDTLVKNVFNKAHTIVREFLGTYDCILEKEKVNGHCYYLTELLTELDQRLTELKSQDLTLINVDKIKNEIVLDLSDINTYLNLIRRRKLRLSDAEYKDDRHKSVVDKLGGLYEEYKNKMNAFINLLKTTALYEEPEIQQGIELLAMKLDIYEVVDCETMNKLFGNILYNFMRIRRIMNDTLRGYINEGNCQDIAFNEIDYYLTMINENINYINEKMQDDNINVDVVNNTMEGVGACILLINVSIKKLNRGKVPDWFIKNISAMPNMVLNSKIQAIYWLCINCAKNFLSSIDKIRENTGGAKIQENFDIENLNLMSGIEQEGFELLHKSVVSIKPSVGNRAKKTKTKAKRRGK